MPTHLSAEQKSAKMSEERAFLTKLLEAALKGDFEGLETSVKGYCRQHDNVHPSEVLLQFKDGKKRTAMHFACQSLPSSRNSKQVAPDQDIVYRILHSSWLQESARQKLIRFKDVEGLTPLMLAVQVGDPKLAEQRAAILLEVGDLSDSSCLSEAKPLSKLGLARSKAGATALHYAAGSGASSTAIKLIYERGHVALKTSSLQGGTPLHWACAVPPSKDFRETIKACLDCGADLNSSSTSNDSVSVIPPPLVMAIAAGNDAHAKCLLQESKLRSIDLMPTLSFALPGGVNVFHMAADMNLVGTLALLLELSRNPDYLEKQDAEGLTPLELAAKEDHLGCVLLLLPSPEIATEKDARLYIDQFKSNPKPIYSPPLTLPEIPKKPDCEKTGPSKVEADAQEYASKVTCTTPSKETRATALSLKAEGNLFFAKSEWTQAMEEYTLAIELDPTDATFYSNRSACYVATGKYNEALYDAVVARTLRPDWPKAAYRMAVARLGLGKFEDAALSAWEGLQQDQDNDELKTLLQKCVRKGRKEHKGKKDSCA
jgi:ankyrin repeat protein